MLIILATHPIQYQVPLWQALARDGRVPFEVWYLTHHGVAASHDREFGKSFAWDLDMLADYPHRLLDAMPGASPNAFWPCRSRESLADRLRKRGAKALWIQGWQVAGYWQAVWAAKQAGVEVWLRAESNDLAPVPLWKRAIKKIILGQFLRRVDRFLCIGTGNRRLYQRYGVKEERLYSAPYAVDNERFKRQAETLKNRKAEIRKGWGIPEDAFCVMFCGKFIAKKRPLDLVEAARLLLDQKSVVSGQWSVVPKVHLLFVGSGELGAELREACHVVFDAENQKSEVRNQKSEGPSDIRYSSFVIPYSLPPATFAGFLNQTEISKAYVAADCLVLPSDYGETWGLVVNEAMASGLPCVISDQCGSSVDLGNVGANTVFPCGDTAALADRLLETSCRRNSNQMVKAQTPPPGLAQTIATVVLLCSQSREGAMMNRVNPNANSST